MIIHIEKHVVVNTLGHIEDVADLDGVFGSAFFESSIEGLTEVTLLFAPALVGGASSSGSSVSSSRGFSSGTGCVLDLESGGAKSDKCDRQSSAEHVVLFDSVEVVFVC